MSNFEHIGDAMLLAAEGNNQIARMISRKFSAMLESCRGWIAAMPTSLPPTESHLPK